MYVGRWQLIRSRQLHRRLPLRPHRPAAAARRARTSPPPPPPPPTAHNRHHKGAHETVPRVRPDGGSRQTTRARTKQDELNWARLAQESSLRVGWDHLAGPVRARTRQDDVACVCVRARWHLQTETAQDGGEGNRVGAGRRLAGRAVFPHAPCAPPESDCVSQEEISRHSAGASTGKADGRGWSPTYERRDTQQRDGELRFRGKVSLRQRHTEG